MSARRPLHYGLGSGGRAAARTHARQVRPAPGRPGALELKLALPAIVSTTGGLRVRSRRGWNMTALVPELADLLPRLTLDGELVAFGEDKLPSSASFFKAAGLDLTAEGAARTVAASAEDDDLGEEEDGAIVRCYSLRRGRLV